MTEVVLAPQVNIQGMKTRAGQSGLDVLVFLDRRRCPKHTSWQVGIHMARAPTMLSSAPNSHNDLYDEEWRGCRRQGSGMEMTATMAQCYPVGPVTK
jgi:hypothetical protein